MRVPIRKDSLEAIELERHIKSIPGANGDQWPLGIKVEVAEDLLTCDLFGKGVLEHDFDARSGFGYDTEIRNAVLRKGVYVIENLSGHHNVVASGRNMNGGTVSFRMADDDFIMDLRVLSLA